MPLRRPEFYLTSVVGQGGVGRGGLQPANPYAGYPSQLQPINGLVTNYWRMGEVSGSRLNQISGGGSLTEVSGATLSTAGHVGQLAALFASSGTLTTPSTTALSWTADRSIWFWFQNTLLNADFRGAFAKGANKPGLFINQASNVTDVRAGAVDLSGAYMSENAWHFAVITYSISTTTINFYLDNALYATSAVIPDLTDAGAFTVGVGSGVNVWRGPMEQMGVMSAVANAATRSFLWNNGAGIQLF